MVVVVGFIVARSPERPFCQADGILDGGIPDGYGARRDSENGCAWTIYAPGGSPAPASAYADADRRLIPYPGPRPSTFETLAPVLALPIVGLGLVGLGIWGIRSTERQERNDRRNRSEQRGHET